MDNLDGSYVPPAPAVPSLPKRLLQVFFSPGELFPALRANPVWFGALAVASALVVLSVAVLPPEMWVNLVRDSMIQRGQEVPAGFGSAGAIIRVFSVLAGGVAFFAMAFIFAGIVTLVFSFLLGDQGRYTQYLSVVAHAMIISALGSLLLVPLKISQGQRYRAFRTCSAAQFPRNASTPCPRFTTTRPGCLHGCRSTLPAG